MSDIDVSDDVEAIFCRTRASRIKWLLLAFGEHHCLSDNVQLLDCKPFGVGGGGYENFCGYQLGI